MSKPKLYDKLEDIAKQDVETLHERYEDYGDSWAKRGGCGAYMVAIRKADRLEQSVEKYKYDVFEALRQDPREEGVIDDIRDLRRYLMLIEAHHLAEKEWA